MQISNQIAELEELKQNNRYTLVDVFTDWCAPCKAMKEVLMSTETHYPDIKFVGFNLEDPAWYKDNNVKSVPTVILYDNKTGFSNRISGLQDQQAIRDFIDKFIESSKFSDHER